MLLDLVERAIDGLVVGDVALDAEQPLRRARTAMGDSDLVTVFREPRATASPMPRFPPVTSTERETKGGRPPAVWPAVSAGLSVTAATVLLASAVMTANLMPEALS